MLKIGDYVVYGSSGVCRVASIESKCFDGVHNNEYCMLAPVFEVNSVFYIPLSSVEASVRQLLSREGVLEMIRNMPKIPPLQISDLHSRKEIFDQILKSGDYRRLISMIKLLYNENQERSLAGKKQAYSDQRAMNDAEELICQEISVVLGIEKSEVVQYIMDIINQ